MYPEVGLVGKALARALLEKITEWKAGVPF
jgi:hypothetical protein